MFEYRQMIFHFSSELCGLDRPRVFLYVHRNNVSGV